MTSDATGRFRRARVIIDEQALRHNLQQVRRHAPGASVMAVVKANAYGHGMLRVAACLKEADAFAVALPSEAFALRDAGIARPVTVLQGVATMAELRRCEALDIQPVFHHESQLSLLQAAPPMSLSAWLKLDTGMHRLGVPVSQGQHFARRLLATGKLRHLSVMSHFANADTPADPRNAQQLAAFSKAVAGQAFHRASMANSAAITALPESHFDVVRPGIMLYGSSPLSGRSAGSLGLRAVMQFESELVAIHPRQKGDAIGYGSRWICPQAMTVGVVAAGYADGYPRHAVAGTPVWVNGRRCRLLGRVSMDSLCVDLGDDTARVGERVVLWGKELAVDEVAAGAGTIGYELLCHAGGLLA